MTQRRYDAMVSRGTSLCVLAPLRFRGRWVCCSCLGRTNVIMSLLRQEFVQIVIHTVRNVLVGEPSGDIFQGFRVFQDGF